MFHYLLDILDVRVDEGDAGHPHGPAVPVGALPVELGSRRLKHVTALGAQELLEDIDHSHPIAPVGLLLVLLSKPGVGRGENTRGVWSVAGVCDWMKPLGKVN